MTTIKSEPMQFSEMGGESKQSSSSSGTKGICNSMEELQQLFNKFKNFYLPQLESLYEDCTWLRGKLGLDDKKDMHQNEVRLVQFSFLIDAVVHQIQRYKIINGFRDSGASLLTLEKKIVKDILPLQQRLKMRLLEARKEPPSMVANKGPTLSKQPQPPAGYPVAKPQPTGPSVEAFLNKPLDSLLGGDEINQYSNYNDGRSNSNNPAFQRQLGDGGNVSWNDNENFNLLFDMKANQPTAANNSMSNGGVQHQQHQVDSYVNKQSAPIIEDEYVSQRRRRRLSQIVPNPRKAKPADYTCSVCNEQYQQMVVENPWWAVAYQQCRKCNQMQIPRLDIMAEANAIEHDPNVQALYGEGLEDSGDDQSIDGDMDGGNAFGNNGEVEGEGEKEAEEHFGSNADGFLERAQASKLLVLMCHARTCTGVHSSPKHAEICKSTKYLMLHIRDCNGMDIHGRACSFPWCTPCKRMLEHLTHCYEPGSCTVCNPWSLPDSFKQLRSLNQQNTCLEL